MQIYARWGLHATNADFLATRPKLKFQFLYYLSEDNVSCLPCFFQYDARFGDVFWNSSIENMLQHIFRIMTSWAVVADIWYLPPVKRLVRFSFSCILVVRSIQYCLDLVLLCAVTLKNEMILLLNP